MKHPRLADTGAIIVLALWWSPAAASASPSAPTQFSRALGVWTNPKQTVRVRTGNCAGNLCGWVVWASPKALADARNGGVNNLIGTALLRNYAVVGAGRFQGQVYVPDMGKSFFSTIQQVNANVLNIKGCILGGLICKSQTWHRVA